MKPHYTYRDVALPAGLPGCGRSETLDVPEGHVAIGGGVQLLNHGDGSAAKVQVFDGPGDHYGQPTQWFYQLDACGTDVHTSDRMVRLRLYVISVPVE